MKKIMTLLLALAMVFALAACGDATRTDASTESAVPETTDAAATDTPVEDVPEAVESMVPQMSDITVKDVLDRGGRLILMSHLGRPRDHEPGLSLAPVVVSLASAAL